MDASAETPSQRLVRSENDATLEQALERLPDDERLVLQLRYIEGRTVTEIADAMGLSRDALIWIIKRALRRVRADLPEDLGR